MEHKVIFDKPYSQEKIKEGLGVYMALITGACNKCPHLSECEGNEHFKFPQNASCMREIPSEDIQI